METFSPPQGFELWSPGTKSQCATGELPDPLFVAFQVRHEHKFSLPGFVYHTAVQVAEAKNLPVDKVLEASRANVRLIYGYARLQAVFRGRV